MELFKQNPALAEAILQKIEKEKANTMDPLKVIENLTSEEMRELILYLVYPIDTSIEYNEYPDTALFPKVLAFYHLHPRETSGAQGDTLSLFYACYFSYFSDSTKGALAHAVNSLLSDCVLDNGSKHRKIKDHVINQLLLLESFSETRFIDTRLLTLFSFGPKGGGSVKNQAVMALAQHRDSLYRPSVDMWLSFAKKGNHFNVRVSFEALMNMKDKETAALKAIGGLSSWFERDMDVYVIEEALCACICHMQGNRHFISKMEGSEEGCPRAIQATEWLLLQMKEWKPEVSKGLARFIRDHLVDFEGNEKKTAELLSNAWNGKKLIFFTAEYKEKLLTGLQEFL